MPWLTSRLIARDSLHGVSLRQRKWDRADGQKQKQVKRASDKMRFNSGINLFFHWVASFRFSS
jgi:hypothetical protein